MPKSVLSPDHVDHHREHDGYDALLESIQNTFDSASGAVFTTNAQGLWSAFLENLPEQARQHYTCHACKHFIERFGGLVRISEGGKTSSAVWGNVPDFFKASVNAILKIVNKARVNGVFVSSLDIYGNPTTSDHKGRADWCHMAITPPADMVWKSVIQTANQRAAEKAADFQTLIGGLAVFRIIPS